MFYRRIDIENMKDILLLSINSLSGKSIVLDNIVVYGVPILFLVLVGLILFTKSKKLFATTIITLLISGLIDLIFNLIMHVNRPFASEIANQITSISYHAPTNSFPSTHTLIAFSLAFPLLFYFRKELGSGNKLWIGVISLSLAFIIGLSRLYLGVHWTTDVLGSVIITFVVGYFVNKFVDEIFNNLFSSRNDNKKVTARELAGTIKHPTKSLKDLIKDLKK